MIIEPIPVSSGLSVGELTGIIVGIVLIIMGLSVILAIVFTLKLKNVKPQQVIRSLKSELRSDQLSDPDPKDSVAEIEKYAESDHFGSGNNHEDTVDENNQPSDSKQTRTYSHDGPPVCSYLYAEIDVVTKRKNKIPEPSSTEDNIDHHVYAVLDQPSNQIQITNTDINIDQDGDHPESQD